MLRNTMAVAMMLLAATVASTGGRGEPKPATNDPGGPADGTWAVFAGGCFWCMEHIFEEIAGVSDVVSGYAGGSEANPQYLDVARGLTGHTEVVRVQYDPEVVSYEQLLAVFWRSIDPLDAGGQFCDRGSGYRSAIFYRTDEERLAAEQSRRELEGSGRFQAPIVTEITLLPALPGSDGFWPAEEYHQDFAARNPARYSAYKAACNRSGRLMQLWGDEAGAPWVPRN